MFIIAGLGNPGNLYAHTRHNAGFDVIDVIADKYNIDVKEKKHNAFLGRGTIDGKKVILVKPMTFMNASGKSLAEIVDYYKVNPTEELIVIYDDISLEPGRLRIRRKGSAGGHNGVKSIIAKVGTQEFLRIKVGVGAKPENWDLADYVLAHMSGKERECAKEAYQNAADAVSLLVNGEIDKAMNRYN